MDMSSDDFSPAIVQPIKPRGKEVKSISESSDQDDSKVV
jgi:hypothetical protein